LAINEGENDGTGATLWKDRRIIDETLGNVIIMPSIYTERLAAVAAGAVDGVFSV
jgi:hypothetical protein